MLQMKMAMLPRTRNSRTVGEGVAKLLCRVCSDFFSVIAIFFPLFNNYFAFEKQNLKQWNPKGIVLGQDVIWSS